MRFLSKYRSSSDSLIHGFRFASHYRRPLLLRAQLVRPFIVNPGMGRSPPPQPLATASLTTSSHRLASSTARRLSRVPPSSSSSSSSSPSSASSSGEVSSGGLSSGEVSGKGETVQPTPATSASASGASNPSASVEHQVDNASKSNPQAAGELNLKQTKELLTKKPAGDSKSSKKLSAMEKMRALAEMYGLAGLIVYYTVNVTSIALLFVFLQLDVAGLSGPELLVWLDTHFGSYSPIDLKKISPTASNLTLAWLLNHFLGPIQIVITIWLTPFIARYLQPFGWYTRFNRIFATWLDKLKKKT